LIAVLVLAQVSAEAEIHVEPRDHDEDQYLVIACDGIWDVMSNEDCGAYIKREVEAGNPTLGDVSI
jgi:serine/threonine protein phosphatase PrpC